VPRFVWKCSCFAFGFIAFAVACHAPAIAQDPQETIPAEGEAPESEPQPAEGDVETPPTDLPLPPVSGDVIHFKFGAPMMGVQIIRSTPRYYEVETAEGVPPLQVLRRLVDRVEYDDIDPLEQRRLREQKAAEEASVVSGEQLAPELRAKLTTPLDDALEPFVNRDLVEVLTDLSAETEVQLEINDSVHAIPAEQRAWTVENTEGLTFMSLLQEQLRPKFPHIRIEFHFDKVVLIAAPIAETPLPVQEPVVPPPPSSPF
jgi:hypothetical protein